MMNEKSVLTVHEAAMEYGFPECGLRTIIKEGRIPIIKIGNRAYVTRKALDEFLAKGGAPYAE
ncbi:MAG: helix-turn-helix domain-containing protein [Clostridiales bacterium]|nr:helix-turn-helix domain-containing protein [Clostridiales bacterium]